MVWNGENVRVSKGLKNEEVTCGQKLEQNMVCNGKMDPREGISE